MNKKKPNKNYFDNKKVEELIILYKIDNNNEKIKKELILEINKVVKGIINLYRYYIFEEIEDLTQFALEACFKAIKKFDVTHPRYSSAFNYFSLTAKMCLLNYTFRKKKHRNLLDITDFYDIEYESKSIDKVFLTQDLKLELLSIIDRNFLGLQRLNYIKLTLILNNYLSQTQKFKKSDFYIWGKNHGIHNQICRSFLKDLGKYYNKIINDLIIKD